MNVRWGIESGVEVKDKISNLLKTLVAFSIGRLTLLLLEAQREIYIPISIEFCG